MELSRRTFLKGFGAAALVGTALTVAGVSVDDAVSVGRVYFFPKDIKIAKSLADSNYFVTVDTPWGKQTENRFFRVGDESTWKPLTMLRREIYDPKEFYADKHCLPIKVEYITEEKIEKQTQAFLQTSPKVVTHPDGSKWHWGKTYDEKPNEGTRGKDWGRIILTDA